MTHPNLLLIANALYIRVDSDHKEIAPKYVDASISGYILSGCQLTLEEIKERHKDSSYPLIEVKSFLDLKEAYNKH